MKKHLILFAAAVWLTMWPIISFILLALMASASVYGPFMLGVTAVFAVPALFFVWLGRQKDRPRDTLIAGILALLPALFFGEVPTMIALNLLFGLPMILVGVILMTLKVKVS